MSYQAPLTTESQKQMSDCHGIMAIRLPFYRRISFPSFSQLKLMWLRKSVPSKRIWPFSDELAAVAHCFPALPARREQHALIHNLESRPKSDERDCFENKKTDKQEFAEPQDGKPHQMPGKRSEPHPALRGPKLEASPRFHNNAMRSRSFKAKRHSLISAGHHSDIGQQTSAPCLPLSA